MNKRRLVTAIFVSVFIFPQWVMGESSLTIKQARDMSDSFFLDEYRLFIEKQIGHLHSTSKTYETLIKELRQSKKKR